MPDRAGAPPGTPAVYSIAAHRGFADALVAGLIPRYAASGAAGDDAPGLARLTLLLPSRRAGRAITEAFIRASDTGRGEGGGLLLPRMVVVGDLDMDEALGALLDPLATDAAIPLASDPTHRWLRLAQWITQLEGGDAPRGAALLRRAQEAGQVIDRLAVEGIAPESLQSPEIIGLVADSAQHWHDSTRGFLRLHAAWRIEQRAAGEIDPPDRRNRLFDAAAAAWSAAPPPTPIVAAGITSASPSLARLLRVVAGLPGGGLVLPDLDLTMEAQVWDALGRAGVGDGPDDPPFGRGDAFTHPQYHLKLLLNRMGINRDEVRAWHRAGIAAAPPARSRAISSLFLPPAASAGWVDLPESRRRLAGVRLMESAHPGEEAQAIAILIRQALEEPGRRVALIMPSRALAARVVAHLQRWGIAADDSAGRPLPQTAAGRVLLLLAELMRDEAAPVPLVAVLSHPLVGAGGPETGVEAGDGRAAWLDHARTLDLALRGPRPAPGLQAISALVAELAERAGGAQIAAWWQGVAAVLEPLLALAADPAAEVPLAAQLTALAQASDALCGPGLWAQADGRALAMLVDQLTSAAQATATTLPPRDLPAVLREAMDRTAVRPPWGGHPRVAIYGLIEGRMSRADLTICGALTEGSWPAAPAPDPLLPPAVLRHLGIVGGDFRIGLAAHDLASALGAPQVVLSWAQRDEAGPVIPSRFVLRVQAMLGAELAARHTEHEAVILARHIDRGRAVDPAPRPQPRPTAEQRRVAISATALDRLRGDPYQFYARAILGLGPLDGLDAAPSPAWQGTAVHAILDRWHKAGAPPGRLIATADEVLDSLNAHPLTRSLWRPRLLAALGWVDSEIVALRGEGRGVLVSEARGEMRVGAIRVHGRADRIDRLADGSLAIVDYKTGAPPSATKVRKGFALQLGLIGLIAQDGGFPGVAGTPEAFEYWSLTRDIKKRSFGWRCQPLAEGKTNRNGIPREDFLAKTRAFLDDALARWIIGDEPFTARLNPDLAGYSDYDQLMRLDEWIGRQPGEGG